jgi:hypothetical protein
MRIGAIAHARTTLTPPASAAKCESWSQRPDAKERDGQIVLSHKRRRGTETGAATHDRWSCVLCKRADPVFDTLDVPTLGL